MPPEVSVVGHDFYSGPPYSVVIGTPEKFFSGR